MENEKPLHFWWNCALTPEEHALIGRDPIAVFRLPKPPIGAAFNPDHPLAEGMVAFFPLNEGVGPMPGANAIPEHEAEPKGPEPPKTWRQKPAMF